MIFSIAPNLLNRLHSSYGDTTQIGPKQHLADLEVGETMYLLTPMDKVVVDGKEALEKGDYIHHMTVQRTGENKLNQLLFFFDRAKNAVLGKVLVRSGFVDNNGEFIAGKAEELSNAETMAEEELEKALGYIGPGLQGVTIGKIVTGNTNLSFNDIHLDDL